MSKGHAFPASFGFTGSSPDGPVPVRAYRRGGRVVAAGVPGSDKQKMQITGGGAKKTLRQPVIASNAAAKPSAGKQLMPGYKKGGKIPSCERFKSGGKVKGPLSSCR